MSSGSIHDLRSNQQTSFREAKNFAGISKTENSPNKNDDDKPFDLNKNLIADENT